jgi:c-di-GMP-binding flagellar brake protein YcgR
MNERRQCIRVECELPSRFRNLDPSYPPKIAEAMVKNISRGGVCLRVDEFIPIQCCLHFYLTLPNHVTLEVKLALAWIVEIPHLGKYEMGARFVEMSSEQEDAIQNFQYEALLQKIPARHKLPRDPGLAA